MKRILIALAVLLAVQVADAQVKSPAAAKKALDKAIEISQNEKKASKPDTWLKLAAAYMDAYNAPVGSAWIGAQKQELQLLMGSEKPIATESAVLGGEPCTKDVYADKEFYFNQAGQLVLINVTNPVVENALEGALGAYQKAWEMDVKQSKAKKVNEGLELLARKFLDEGMNCYMFEDYSAASQKFEMAAAASMSAPLNKVDTTALYNAGFTAWMVQDYNRAQNFFEKCLANNYYYEGGEVFAKLGDVYAKLGDKEKGRDILEQGFTKFPQSQSILIGLINYYMESGQNTDRLFSLINEAKKNEPDNASLYYVEGNIYKELGNLEKAVESYLKCSDINPNYEYGYIGAGILYYNQAIEIQEKAANEFDDKKYEALVKDFEKALENAFDPFEKAYGISKDDAVRVNIAEYLKNICYRFQDKDAKFKDGYAKYDEVVKTGQPK